MTDLPHVNAGELHVVAHNAERDKLNALAQQVAQLSIPTTPTEPVTVDTLFGWSGANIPDETPEFLATWMSRGNWHDLQAANYLGANNDFTPWIAAHPTKACVVGVPLIPHDSGQDLNSLLDEIISGAQDDNLQGMGTNLSYWTNAKVYARLYWEFNLRNGSSGPGDVLDRSKFIAAWRHAVPLIRYGFYNHSEGQYGFTKPGQQLFIDFSPLSDGADYKAFYPGDEFVDVISMDVYPTIYGYSTPTPDQLLASVNGYLNDVAAFAAQHNKPTALGEWSAWQRLANEGYEDSRGLGDFVPYVDAVFDWVIANNPVYISYYNISDNTGVTLADTPNTLARLHERLSIIRDSNGFDTASTNAARLYLNNAVPTSSGLHDLNFTSVVYNMGAAIGTDNPAHFTIKEPGLYHVIYGLAYDGADNDGLAIQIVHNGVTQSEGSSKGGSARPVAQDYLICQPDDTISAKTYSASSPSVLGGISNTWMAVVYHGPVPVNTDTPD